MTSPLDAFDRAALTYLAHQGSMCGMTLRTLLGEQAMQDFSVGDFYVCMGRLEKMGLVTRDMRRATDPMQHAKRGGRRLAYYSLTDPGLEEYSRAPVAFGPWGPRTPLFH